MQPIPKHSPTSEVVRAIRNAVLAGRFDEGLPGVRVLAKALEVSPQTVSKAIAVLIAEGLIISEGARRKMRVKRRRSVTREPQAGDTRRTLWLVTHDFIPTLPYGVQEVMRRLSDRLADSPWQVRPRVLNFLHAKRPLKAWDAVFEAERPDAMVVWSGRPSLASWARKHQVKTLFIGGTLEKDKVPMLSVRVQTMVGEAMERLIAMGHWRICLPLCFRPKVVSQPACKVMAECLKRAGMSYIPELHTPVSDYEGPGVTEAMVLQIQRKFKPTAWIFWAWREYVAAMHAFQTLGIRIPRDCSVVLLSYDPAMDWYRPSLAHFQMPYGKLVQATHRWVLSGNDAEIDRREGTLKAVWVAGESVAAAQSARR